MDYFNADELLKDEHEDMDVGFAKEYESEHLKLTYMTPEQLAADERLIKLATLIMDEGIHNEASDIQVLKLSEQRAVIRLRVGSEMRPHRMIHGLAADPLAIVFKRMSRADIKESNRPQGGRFLHMYRGEGHDIRASFMPTIRGESISLRILYSATLMDDVTQLGFPPYVLESLQQVLGLKEGLILLTGGTGSGKTTSMYTGINNIMRDTAGSKNVITIENPVEYTIEGAVQSQVNDLYGYTFGEGLKTALRQNPDIILIGEINDQETAETAVRASTSGHLVFSTLHANDVLSVAQAMEHYHVSPYKLSWALQLVLNQSLPNRLCPQCRKARMLSTEELKWVDTLASGEKLLTVYDAVGCEQCEYYGYRGRVLVVEMLDANQEYTRLAMKNMDLVALQDELLKNDKARYYPMSRDVFRHLKEGNIDIPTAQSLLR